MSMLEDNALWANEVKQPALPPYTNEQLNANDENDEAGDFMKILEENKRIVKELNIDTTPKIKYYNHINIYKDEKPLTITFDELDKLSTDDCQKGFIEVILNEDYIHLYFDFDQIKSIEELDSVFEWLADLTDVFDEYTYGGYTDNEEVANSYGFRLFPEGNHFVSMHVIYYQTRISTDDLV